MVVVETEVVGLDVGPTVVVVGAVVGVTLGSTGVLVSHAIRTESRTPGTSSLRIGLAL